jgi:hypothetical protein
MPWLQTLLSMTSSSTRRAASVDMLLCSLAARRPFSLLTNDQALIRCIRAPSHHPESQPNQHPARYQM